MPRRGKRKKRSELKELLLLLILKSEGPVGRYRLKDMLNLSEHEGLVRLMLADLQKNNYVSASRAGCELTSKGISLSEESLKKYNIIDVKELDLGPLKAGPESLVVHVHGVADRIESAMETRDVAVRAGASGAIILTYKNRSLGIPAAYPDLSQDYPDLTKHILRSFGLSDNDVLIVGFSEDRWRALEGALLAAVTLTQLAVQS